MGKLVKRSQRRAYYGVPAAESGTTTYTRMTKFTSLSKSKNPKTYSRQYVDEDAAIEDVVGYAESISYAFDEEVGNTVHADIANWERTLSGRSLWYSWIRREKPAAPSGQSSVPMPSSPTARVTRWRHTQEPAISNAGGHRYSARSHPPMIGKPSHSLRTRNVPAVFLRRRANEPGRSDKVGNQRHHPGAGH